MKKHLKHVVVWTLVLAMVVLTGCGGGNNTGGTGTEPNETPEKSNEFVYAAGTEPTTFDPHFITDVNTARAAMQIFETLVTWNEDSKIVPLLAESWTTSEDNKTWTFKLKEGVKFHDGAPFNAEAVKYNFERILSPEVASPRKSSADMVEKVEVVSEYEVNITTKEPAGAFLAQLTNYNLSMLSPKAAEELGKEFGQKPSGTGPLMLDVWEPGKTLTYTKFDGYWGTKSTIDKLTYKTVPEDSSRVMMLKTGDADVISGLPPIQVEELKSDKNVDVVIAPGYRTIYIGTNMKKDLFKDVKVRQAINYAIDKKSIIDNVLRGLSIYPAGVESPAIMFAATDLTPYDYNPEKAKQLLAEAGYPNGFKTTLHTPEGRYPMDKQVAEVVQSMLKEVGIDAEIIVLDWGAYQEATTKGDVTNLFLLGKGSPAGDPDYDLTLSFGTGGKMNNSFYSNTEVDKLLADQKTSVDQEYRAKVLHEIQEKIHNDSPWAVLYYENQTMGKRADVDGFKVQPNEILDLRYLTRK